MSTQAFETTALEDTEHDLRAVVMTAREGEQRAIVKLLRQPRLAGDLVIGREVGRATARTANSGPLSPSAPAPWSVPEQGRFAPRRREVERATAGTANPGPLSCRLYPSGNPTQFFDFKFKCPPGTPTGCYDKHFGAVLRAGRSSSPGGDFYIRGGRNSQFNNYKKLGKELNPPTTADPRPIDSSACK